MRRHRRSSPNCSAASPDCFAAKTKNLLLIHSSFFLSLCRCCFSVLALLLSAPRARLLLSNWLLSHQKRGVVLERAGMTGRTDSRTMQRFRICTPPQSRSNVSRRLINGPNPEHAPGTPGPHHHTPAQRRHRQGAHAFSRTSLRLFSSKSKRQEGGVVTWPHRPNSTSSLTVWSSLGSQNQTRTPKPSP